MFSAKTWKDRVTEYPTRRVLTKTDGSKETVTVARSEGTVSQEGDAFNAANMNDLEARIATAVGDILGPYTIPSGATSYVISDASITETSIIDVYPSNDTADIMAAASPSVSKSIQAAGSLTIVFETATTAAITIEAVKVVNR